MLLLCNAWHESPVARVGKWKIETLEWRYTYWPTFCQGVAFIMTMNFVVAATRVVHRVPRLWLDDVSLYLCFLPRDAMQSAVMPH